MATNGSHLNGTIPASSAPNGERFRRLSRDLANAMGTPGATACALLVVLAWAISGPFFGYSDDWQLAINTGTTIVTFLMVFFIQNTQNRESRELHLKLNEIIRSLKAARNEIIDCEDLSDEEMARLEEQLRGLAQRYGSSFTQMHEHVSRTARSRAAQKKRHGGPRRIKVGTRTSPRA